jgi:hypothetical protein
MKRARALLILSLAAAIAACETRTQPIDPHRYRLAGSAGEPGDGWDPRSDGPPPGDLALLYPEFFEAVWDPRSAGDPNLLPVRDDLERAPVDRRNYDALNAVAAGYFQTLYLQEAARADESADLIFLTLGFRSAKLVAVPWRAYMEISDAQLRDAIVDFFADATSGRKTGSRPSIGRLIGILDSLATKEPDERRRLRIEALRDDLATRTAHERSSPDR